MAFFNRARSVLRPLLNPNFPSRVLNTAPEFNSSSTIRPIHDFPLNSTETGLGFCGFYRNSTFIGPKSPICAYSKRFHIGSRNVECFREQAGNFYQNPSSKGIKHGSSSISRAKGVNFHGSSSISRAKGVNIHGSSSISSSKGVNIHGSSSISRNFHGSSSISSSKGVNFRGYSSISRAKGVNFHWSSLILRAKGVNFHGSSSISSSKGVNFHGYSSISTNFLGSSSISRGKGVNFHGSSSISRAKGVNFHGSSSIPRAKGVNFHVSYMHSSVSRPQDLHPSVYTSNIQYNVRRYHVDHGKTRSFKKRVQSIKSVIGFYLILVPALCFWVYWTAFYFHNLETVPYTRRTRTMPIPVSLQRNLTDIGLQQEKQRIKSMLLPATDPSSVRARLIFQNIIEALKRTIDLEPTWGEEDGDWIDKAAKGISYLDGVEWEIFVYHSNVDVASCLADGKILFPLPYVEKHTDAEIAYIIAHETGHVIARHAAEKWARHIQILPVELHLLVSQFILSIFGLFELFRMITDEFLRQPLNHKLEIEADTIALYLMAYAGYDPQVAPKYHKKESKKLFGDKESLSHPSSKKRFEVLSQSKALEEAILIYQENKSRAKR